MKYIFSFIFYFFIIVAQSQNPYFEISKQMEIYNDVLLKLSTNYIDELNMGDLMQKNTKQLLNGLDRFTTFYDEQSILNQKMRQEGHFGGLGIKIRPMDKAIIITDILPGTPAERELKIGDHIVAIDGKKMADLSKKVAVNLLNGPAGSKVTLTIKRHGKEIKKSMHRADVALNAVTGQYLDGDIGYIQLAKFNAKAAQQVKKSLLALKQKGAKKLIIDLRNNPGGLLFEVIKIVNFFIPQGKIVVTTKGRFDKYNKTYRTRNPSVDEEIPIVILVNNHSASASEILSGSLQDYDRAVVMGDTTYGKGLVQRTFKLKYGTYMKQTISKYYIPSGRLIQKIDYWHRDKNGKPLLMRNNLAEKDYKTAHGRIVHNLGGVVPDIVLKSFPNHAALKDLINKGILFDFVTDWIDKQNRVPKNMAAVHLTDADFEQFMQYLDKNNQKPQTSDQKLLKSAYQKAKKNKQPAKILNQYQKLMAAYDVYNIQSIRNYKQFILNTLQQDIVNRYFGKDSLIKYRLKTDPLLLKAKAILNKPETYHQILKN